MAERPGAVLRRGVRLRVTVIAVAVTAVILVAVGAVVVLAQRELLRDDLAAADPAARQNVAEASRELAWLLVGALPVVVVGVATLVWWLVGRTLRPVEAIRSEVAEITASDLHRRVPVPGTGDEIDRLALTMNAMLARLEASRERQDRFVADASHELRTPLARMIAELEVDEAHPDTVDASRTRAAHLRAARRLADLVDALLTLARLDGTSAPSPGEAVDLDDVVLAEAAALAVPAAVTLDVSGVCAAQLHVDARMLGIVVRNLLDNAVRYAASRVTVSVVESGTEITMVVADDGPGIPAEQRTRVFERFTSLDESRSGGSGGSGLGLAIVRSAVRRTGGQVRAGDRFDGGPGAVLTVTYPAGACPI